MIYVSVKENYSKEVLSNLLGYINTHTFRELTYGVRITEGIDVVVDIGSPIKEGTLIEITTTSLQDDLCIIIDAEYCRAYVNGDSFSIRKYVEERI